MPSPTDDAWEIDTWLMSCRVLGRQFEHFMLDRAVDAARAAGIRRLFGVYRATAKNSLVSDLFDRLGFRRRGENAEETSYELNIVSATPAHTSFIEQVDETRHAPRQGIEASKPSAKPAMRA